MFWRCGAPISKMRKLRCQASPSHFFQNAVQSGIKEAEEQEKEYPLLSDDGSDLLDVVSKAIGEISSLATKELMDGNPLLTMGGSIKGKYPNLESFSGAYKQFLSNNNILDKSPILGAIHRGNLLTEYCQLTCTFTTPYIVNPVDDIR